VYARPHNVYVSGVCAAIHSYKTFYYLYCIIFNHHVRYCRFPQHMNSKKKMKLLRYLLAAALLNNNNLVNSEDPEIDWCLNVNDEYSSKNPPLLMGVSWGKLPSEDRETWERFNCNERTPWELSKENKEQWCDAVRSSLRGSVSIAVRKKASVFKCGGFTDKKSTAPPPVSYRRSSGNFHTDCLSVHGVKKCGRIISVHWHGRFGNRVFQYAFLCEAARRYAPSIVYLTSDWEGTVLFDITQCPVLVLPDALSNPFNDIFSTVKGTVIEKEKRVTNLFKKYSNSNPAFGSAVPQVWKNLAKKEPPRNKFGHVDAWLNSLSMMYLDSIFRKMDRGYVMQLLRFSDHVRDSKIFKTLSSMARTYDLAQLRRDDVLNVQKPDGTCGSYCVISLKSYENAMADRDINSKDVVWVSDDSKLRTVQSWHNDLSDAMSSLSNKYWQYPTGEQYIPDYMYSFFPDLLLMTFARRFFRAGSSFGFWGAFLNQINPGCSYVYSVDMRQCDRGDLVKRLGQNKKRKAYEYHCPFIASNANHWVLRGKERVPYDDVTWG